MHDKIFSSDLAVWCCADLLAIGILLKIGRSTIVLENVGIGVKPKPNTSVEMTNQEGYGKVSRFGTSCQHVISRTIDSCK